MDSSGKENEIQEIQDVAESFQESAAKVESGINRVLEPEIKEARLSSNEASELIAKLSARITLFGSAIIISNLLVLASLIYF